MIRLIVGLGNPGAEYERTRHNVGFWWVDELAQAHKMAFRNEAKYHGLVARGNVHAHDLWLLKPQTFMNHSGRSVVALALFYKILPNEILVVHDELDLPPGAARLKMGGGHGGHNGLKDIIAHLGTPDFWRLRLGIGHPGERGAVSNYVLGNPRAEDYALLDVAMLKAHGVADLIIDGKTEAAMLKLHSN